MGNCACMQSDESDKILELVNIMPRSSPQVPPQSPRINAESVKGTRPLPVQQLEEEQSPEQQQDIELTLNAESSSVCLIKGQIERRTGKKLKKGSTMASSEIVERQEDAKSPLAN